MFPIGSARVVTSPPPEHVAQHYQTLSTDSRSQYLLNIAFHSLACLYPMADQNTADIIGEYHELFNLPSSHRNFVGLGEISICHSAACLFISGSDDLAKVSSIATILEIKLFSSVSKRESRLVALGPTSNDVVPNVLTHFALNEQYRGLCPVPGRSLSRNFLTLMTKYASLAEIFRPLPSLSFTLSRPLLKD